MKPKIKILFLVILLGASSFLSQQKNNNKNLKEIKRKKVTSLLEVNFRKKQLFF
jgi:hypothetical protein